MDRSKVNIQTSKPYYIKSSVDGYIHKLATFITRV